MIAAAVMNFTGNIHLRPLLPADCERSSVG